MAVLDKIALKSAISTAFASSVVNTDVIAQLHDIVDSYENYFGRLNQTQINALTPSVGQMVFNTDLGKYQFNDGSQWLSLSSEVAGLQKVTINISSAQILNSFTTPITLIPSFGTNKLTIVNSILVEYTYGTVDYPTRAQHIKYTSQTLGSFAIAFFDFAGVTSSFLKFLLPTASDVYANQPVILQTPVGNPVNGDGTLKVTLYYDVLTV